METVGGGGGELSGRENVPLIHSPNWKFYMKHYMNDRQRKTAFKML